MATTRTTPVPRYYHATPLHRFTAPYGHRVDQYIQNKRNFKRVVHILEKNIDTVGPTLVYVHHIGDAIFASYSGLCTCLHLLVETMTYIYKLHKAL